MRRYWSSVLIVFCAFFELQAQVDTVLLQTIHVESNRQQLSSTGTYEMSADTMSLQFLQSDNISTLLSQASNIYFKSYGLGSLASPSNRGAGFGHTAILWNGFNLQSPRNGGIDFSLIPNTFVDEVSIQNGGASTLYGGGTLGGAVYLNNKFSEEEGLSFKIGGGIGSFFWNNQHATIGYSNSKFKSSLRLNQTSAKNDFTYINNRKERATQINAGYSQLGVMQDNEIQINQKQKLKTWLWWTEGDRNIPPSETEGTGNYFSQHDQSFRGGTEWQHTGSKTVSKIRAAYLYESIQFTNDPPGDTYTFIGEAEQSYQLTDNQNLQVGFHYQNDRANNYSLSIIPSRDELAVFAAYRLNLFKDKWQVLPSIRQGWVAGKSIPFTGSLANVWQLNKRLKINSQISKNYKLPTFNDLYWAGQGNPTLLPESAWNTELGGDYLFDYQSFKGEFHIGAYRNLIDNWILWSPNLMGLWTPENTRKVLARGIESSLQLSRKWQQSQLTFKVNYTFTKSTIEAIYNEKFAHTLNKQLIYVPVHKGYVTTRFQYQNWRIQYHHSITTEVFTTTDNQQSIAPYHLGDLAIAYPFQLKKTRLTAQLQVNNIWNRDYEVIAFRPMPLRNYRFTIIWQK